MAAALEELKKKERVTESVVQEARKRNAEIKVKKKLKFPNSSVARALWDQLIPSPFFTGETQKQRKLSSDFTFRRKTYRFD